MSLKVFRRGDIVVMLVMITTFVLSFKSFNHLNAQSVIIFRDNKVIAEYPLSENRTFSVEGKIGEIKILIKDRGVKVVESSCSHKICIRTGEIKAPNSQIVCAPNHIMIVINSSKEDSIDAISR